MKRIINIPTYLIMLFLIASSCQEIETYSEIPGIIYKSFELSEYLLIDTSDLGNQYIGGILTFEFKDGDGDFGVPQGDTTCNVIVNQYEMRDGEYYIIERDDTLYPTLNVSIKKEDPMIREGQNKLLKGDIELFFKYYKNNQYDSFRYDFYIKDQADHHSNMESTDLIVIDWNNYLK